MGRGWWAQPAGQPACLLACPLPALHCRTAGSQQTHRVPVLLGCLALFRWDTPECWKNAPKTN